MCLAAAIDDPSAFHDRNWRREVIMKRRAFLLGSAAFTLSTSKVIAGTTMSSAKMAGMDMSGAAAESLKRIRKLPVGAPLSELAKLTNQSNVPAIFEATVEAGIASHEFMPGLATEVLAYNGSVPGVMIEVSEGDRIKIAFKNRIPDQISTIHWHGLEIPADQDGNPTDPVASGSDRLYEFTIPEGSAGSYWYHPHPHGQTSEQVYRGLAAPFIVRSKNDPLPPELRDTVLFISSVSLNTDGTIAENTATDLMNGREGDHVLVNGTKQPVLTLPPGSSRRFRIYNATNGRFLRLGMDGHTMTLVGTDGGLIVAPIKGLKELFLAPAERAEVVITFHDTPGNFALKSLPYERGWMGMDKPAAQSTTIMNFALVGATVQPIMLPEKLRDIVPFGEAKTRKRIEFSETMGMANGMMMMGFQINGKTFDMNRIDLKSRVGEVELWEVFNNSDMDHPFHIHGTQFQIVEREKNGNRAAASFLAWKDTVNITARETVRIKLRHTMQGLRMYHCHILEHEDSGMMGTLDVI